MSEPIGYRQATVEALRRLADEEATRLLRVVNENGISIETLSHVDAPLALRLVKALGEPLGITEVEIDTAKRNAKASADAFRAGVPDSVPDAARDALGVCVTFAVQHGVDALGEAYLLAALAHASGLFEGILVGCGDENAAKRARRELAHLAANVSMKNPQRAAKQVAKGDAFKLWQARRAGKHPKLRTNEQFAMECMRRWPVLTSAKVILGWCTAWNKEAKRQKSQPAS